MPSAVDISPYGKGDAHEHWLDCIRRGAQPPVSNAQTACHVTEILLAGLESAKSGRPVEISSRLPALPAR